MRVERRGKVRVASRVTRLLVCSLAALAAAFGVGTVAHSQAPPLVRVDGGQLQGAYAYMDQIAALQWVRRNIVAFGGNPNNVTVFEFRPDGSAGAGPDARKARLDVTELATESGRRSDYR
jgi:hypothetical protein